jgi:hypothetical protein
MSDDVENRRPAAPLPDAPTEGGISRDGFDEVDHAVVEEAEPAPEARRPASPGTGPGRGLPPVGAERGQAAPWPVRTGRATGPSMPRGSRPTGPQPRQVPRAVDPKAPSAPRPTGPQPRRVTRTAAPDQPRTSRITGAAPPPPSRITGPVPPSPERPTGPHLERKSATFGSEALAEARRTSRMLASGDLQQARAAAGAEVLGPGQRGEGHYSVELLPTPSRVNPLRLALLLAGVAVILGLLVVLVIQISSRWQTPDDALPGGQAFVVQTEVARRGRDLILVADPPCPHARVFFNGRPMTLRVAQHGRRIIFTIPRKAHDGHVELECNGRRHTSRRRLILK